MDKVIKYSINPEHIYQNQASLSDTIRMALYQASPTLFGLLGYDNDSIFVEPTLFCHFLCDIAKTETMPLAQCLIGYIPVAHRPESIPVKADRFGLVNLPNLGYVRANPYETFTLNIAELEQNLIPIQFGCNSNCRLGVFIN